MLQYSQRQRVSSAVGYTQLRQKQQNQYSDFKDVGNVGKFKSRDYDTWQKSWFPACTNVFAFNKYL